MKHQMVNARNLKSLVFASAFGLVAAASAQTNGPTGISARIGIFFPTDRLAQDIGDSWFAFGADYKLNRFSVDSPTSETLSFLSISADYYEKDDLRSIPIVLNYNVRSGQLVYSAGLGVDFFRTFNDDNAGLTGQLAVAYEFGNRNAPSNPIFIQAKYFFSAKSELNGFGVYAGFRF